MKPRKRTDATTELMIAVGAVARNMSLPEARSLAAGKANSIPRTYHELHNTRHADMVRRVRTFLRNLPGYPDDLLDQAQADAVHFRAALADAVEFARRRERLNAGLREPREEDVA